MVTELGAPSSGGRALRKETRSNITSISPTGALESDGVTGETPKPDTGILESPGSANEKDAAKLTGDGATQRYTGSNVDEGRVHNGIPEVHG